ncbi:hypothetical protein LB519_04260 [Mesorhizobium sp. AD1-1]|uniref:hypothetical protein n=1 Tax=Mesorhizobium sp. AD1-1 TaxID=2876621 RepID=UPI001CCA4456|nr:hypothetical protein [Mesorhizobium sp. AD1-1]MBZ9717051.1 hypothetical protein [Mesorhizobium sp. AD1-1]
MNWHLVPYELPKPIADYMGLFNAACDEVARKGRNKGTSINKAINCANFERHATYYVAMPYGGPAARAISSEMHEQAMEILSEAVHYADGTRLVTPTTIEALQAAYPAYANSMADFNQAKNRHIVLPRLELASAREVISPLKRKWVGEAGKFEPDSFSKFCFELVFLERQKGNFSRALRRAYALAFILDVDPGYLVSKPKDRDAFRALAGFVGGWCAYQFGNRIMERYFVHQMEETLETFPDLALRNRIKNHRNYHDKAYNGIFEIYASQPDESKSVMRLYYPSTSASALHNAANTALERGASLDAKVSELGEVTPLDALRLSAEMDLDDNNDPEAALFTLSTLAEWLGKAGQDNAFLKTVADAETLAARNPQCAVAQVRLQRTKAGYFLDLYKKDGRAGDREAAKGILKEAIAESERQKHYEKVAELKQLLPQG